MAVCALRFHPHAEQFFFRRERVYNYAFGNQYHAPGRHTPRRPLPALRPGAHRPPLRGHRLGSLCPPYQCGHPGGCGRYGRGACQGSQQPGGDSGADAQGAAGDCQQYPQAGFFLRGNPGPGHWQHHGKPALFRGAVGQVLQDADPAWQYGGKRRGHRSQR